MNKHYFRPNGLVTISPYSSCSLGGAYASIGAPADATYLVANRAFFYPFSISQPINIKRMFIYNGSAVNGNFDLGIYDKGARRLVSTGSTAQAGINAVQSVAVTLEIGPGLYYLAVVFNNVVGQLGQAATDAYILVWLGCAQMAAAFPLPTLANFASYGSNKTVLVAATTRSTV